MVARPMPIVINTSKKKTESRNTIPTHIIPENHTHNRARKSTHTHIHTHKLRLFWNEENRELLMESHENSMTTIFLSFIKYFLSLYFDTIVCWISDDYPQRKKKLYGFSKSSSHLVSKRKWIIYILSESKMGTKMAQVFSFFFFCPEKCRLLVLVW